MNHVSVVTRIVILGPKGAVLLVAALSLVTSTPAQVALGPGVPRILYGDDDAPLGGDGTIGDTVFRYVQDALAVASPGDEIHVANGFSGGSSGLVKESNSGPVRQKPSSTSSNGGDVW